MILITSPNNSTGLRKHLEELYHLIKKKRLKTDFLLIDEEGHVNTLQKIKHTEPDLIIFGGRNWIIRNQCILNEIGSKKGILFCSPPAQAEISNEEINNLCIYLQWLDEKRIDYLFVGSYALFRLFCRSDIIYLPAPFSTNRELEQIHYPLINAVSIFNDNACHKNIINTIGGVALSQNVERLVTNGSKMEYFNLIRRFGLDKITDDIGFIPPENYLSELSKIKLMLHISFSEGFCYSVVESFFNGTPALVSSAVSWLNIPELTVKDPRDIDEIAHKIDHVMNLNEQKYRYLTYKGYKQAKKICNSNNEHINRWLTNLSL